MISKPKYEIIKELGNGAQGAVYLVQDNTSSQQCAAKVFSKHDRFVLEREILNNIKGNIGFPEIQHATMIDGHHVIIMGLLGESLRSIKDKHSGKLSLRTCFQLMHQMISRLETFHQFGYVHCDLKPDNILIAQSRSDSMIYLVDFGLAHQYLDTNGNHIKQPEKVSFKGSISYCSLNLLNKQYPSRRDDLESLLYVILFLMYGDLPWHNKASQLTGPERLNYVIKMKQEMKFKDYYKNMPKCILKCYKYIRSLSYSADPDYNKLKFFVRKDLESLGHQLDGIFDWTDRQLSPILQLQEPRLSAILLRSQYQKEYEKKSIESISMEADYKDFMSLEIEEGIAIIVRESSPKRNQLSSLSPSSYSYSCEQESDHNFKLNKEDICEEIKQNRSHQMPKQIHSFNLKPFSLLCEEQDDEVKQEAEESNDFEELLQMKSEIQYPKQIHSLIMAKQNRRISQDDHSEQFFENI